MRIKHQSVVAVVVMIVVLSAASTYLRADTGSCGGTSITLPFTDVMSSPFFCQIAEAYFSGLTFGMTATTYNPSGNVPREQMAAFITRTMDQSLKRGSRRAALNQFWTLTPHYVPGGIGTSNIPSGGSLRLVQSDGADLWVADFVGNTVHRVRANDGAYVASWTGATNAYGVLVAAGNIFVTGRINPNGVLYDIDPRGGALGAYALTSDLGSNPAGIAFDGDKIWTANSGTGPGGGSVSFMSLGFLSPTTVSAGFSQPIGILYDGSNIWVTDIGDATLKQLNSSGGVIKTVGVGSAPQFPAFDGTNIWVPNLISDTVTVVRAAGPLAGTVLATLTGNGLSSPRSVAFDGERILVTNGGGNISLWKAADLTQIGFTPAGSGTDPFGACSDGLNFWITIGDSRLARF